MVRRSVIALVIGLSLSAAGTAVAQSNQVQGPAITVSAQSAGQGAAASQAPAKNDYSKGDSWLCRPGRQDACAVDLSTTVVAANGKLSRQDGAANPSAPIECFYGDPTVSNDPTVNSDMIAGPEEK